MPPLCPDLGAMLRDALHLRDVGAWRSRRHRDRRTGFVRDRHTITNLIVVASDPAALEPELLV